MFGNHFYHERIRKAVAMFGALFNNLYVVRKDASGKVLNQQKVPLSYAPQDKYIQRIREQQNLDTQSSIAIKLPRMSFEITGMSYDPTRQLPKTGNITVNGTDNTKRKKIYNTVPYNITFQLNVYARAQDDCLQIVEQIIPFFSPQYTLTIRPLGELPNLTEDVPVILSGVSFSDDYEGSLEDRRIIIYTLDFDMKANFHSDVSEGSIIRKAISNIYQQAAGALGEDIQSSRVTLDPTPTGITADSDYGFASTVTLYEELFAKTYDLALVAQPISGYANINNNQVTNVVIDSGGAGFSATSDIFIEGPPLAATASAEAIVDSAVFRIDRLNVTDSGSNYITAPTVTIYPPPNAELALANATMDSSGKRVKLINLTANGTNYYVVPDVTVTPPLADSVTAAGILQLDDSGYVTAIRLTESGAFYDSAPNVEIAYNLVSDSAGFISQYKYHYLTLKANIADGRVISVPTPSIDSSVDSIGYVLFDAPTGGRISFAARAEAVIDSDSRTVVGVNIIDSGNFYQSTPTVIIGGPPAPIQATAVANISDYKISGFTITQRGTNYTTAPQVVISNPPTAVQATAKLVLDANNRVSSILITDPGTNYTIEPRVDITNPVNYENVQFTDSEQVTMTLSNGVIVTGYVKNWGDSANILTIDKVSSSDNKYYPLEVGVDVIGQTSDALLVVNSVSEGNREF
jgi:hypothetical protein